MNDMAVKLQSHLALEQFAAISARRHGRGVVVAAVDGRLAELVFVNLADWNADPLACLADDPRFASWLNEYDPAREFVLIEAIREGEDMIIHPFRLSYELVAPQPVASAA